MQVWVLLNTEHDKPVQHIYTDYESAMMAWSSEAADGERENLVVTEEDGVYTVDNGNGRTVMQEMEL